MATKIKSLSLSKQQVEFILSTLGADESFLQDIYSEMKDGLWVIEISDLNGYRSFSYYAWDIEEDGSIPGITLIKTDNLQINFAL